MSIEQLFIGHLLPAKPTVTFQRITFQHHRRDSLRTLPNGSLRWIPFRTT